MQKKDEGFELSQNEERFALVFAILMSLSQIRGLLYYRLLKVMVIVGHNDIECCFLMPTSEEDTTGVLSDDYYKSLIKSHSRKVPRRRLKIIQYLIEAFEAYGSVCERIVNLGIMDRLFQDFDFFSSSKDTKAAPKVSKKHSEYDFSSCSDSESDIHNISDSKLSDYDMFLHGFFYFFILQDPFIRNYLNLRYEPLINLHDDVLSDLKFFQENFMLQWVQIMV
jgi:hypothetical protein